MNSVTLLIGLLVFAFVGSQIFSGKGGSYRLASGAEYLLLGLALGPQVLGTVERSTLLGFEPIALIGTAWLVLVVGAEYGRQGRARISRRVLLLGCALSASTVALCAGVLYLVCERLHLLEGRDRWLVPWGVALVSSETTRHAVRWVVERHQAEGPLSRLVDALSGADDVVPVLGLAVLFSLTGGSHPVLGLPGWAWCLATLGMGAALGGTAAALLRSEHTASDGWGVLIGATFVATGIASRLGLAAITATFALGLTLVALSRHAAELRSMLELSEQAVILPVLLLAGALVQLEHRLLLGVLVAGALLVRLLVRLFAAPVLTRLAGVPGGVAPALGVGLLSSGALSITVGMSFATHFGSLAGDVVLAVAVALSILGELVGPSGLKRALLLAGEVSAESEQRGTPEAERSSPVAAPGASSGALP